VYRTGNPLSATGSTAFLFPGKDPVPEHAPRSCCSLGVVREAIERSDEMLSPNIPQGLSRFIFPPPVFTPRTRPKHGAAHSHTDSAACAWRGRSRGRHSEHCSCSERTADFDRAKRRLRYLCGCERAPCFGLVLGVNTGGGKMNRLSPVEYSARAFRQSARLLRERHQSEQQDRGACSGTGILAPETEMPSSRSPKRIAGTVHSARVGKLGF